MTQNVTPPTVPASCDFTVFGGTGDLAAQALPALYLRDLEGQLPDDTRIIGVSRAELDDDGYRTAVRVALTTYVAADDLDDAVVDRLLGRLHHLMLDAEHPDDWHRLPPAQGPPARRGDRPGLLPGRRARRCSARSAVTSTRSAS